MMKNKIILFILFILSKIGELTNLGGKQWYIGGIRVMCLLGKKEPKQKES